MPSRFLGHIKANLGDLKKMGQKEVGVRPPVPPPPPSESASALQLHVIAAADSSLRWPDRLRRWPNIKSTLVQRLVYAGLRLSHQTRDIHPMLI